MEAGPWQPCSHPVSQNVDTFSGNQNFSHIVTDRPVGLTDNSIYNHYSSNNWNVQEVKQNTHKNFKNHLQ